MTTYEKKEKCINGTCTPLDQCRKTISANNDVLHFCLVCENIVNPPKCTGGCTAWEACIIRTSKAGKEYRVCAVCKNYAFDPSKPKTPYGGAQKRSYGAVGVPTEVAGVPVSGSSDAAIAELRQAINNINTRVGVLEMKVAISKAHEASSQSTH
jgi:hypothetical protein